MGAIKEKKNKLDTSQMNITYAGFKYIAHMHREPKCKC